MKNPLIYVILLIVLTAQTAFAAENTGAEGVIMKNPGADLWRDVRQRDIPVEGVSQVKTVDSNVLINPHANRWSRFRVGTLTYAASFLLVGLIVVLIIFYILRGKIRIEGGLSGHKLFRFNDYERILHWTLAIVFLFLAITGLALLLGRPFLIPLLGQELFSLIASSSKEGHNLFGPVFLLSLVLIVFQFTRRNIYEKGDLSWLLRGGGVIGKTHVSGGFFNMGEKTWYWIVILLGLVISVSGLILVSPNFGQGRVVMELSHVVHAISAVILIALSFGHIYLAIITEGTTEAMKTGYTDVKWAEAHHDRWARECRDKQLAISFEEYCRLQGAPTTIATEENN